MRIDSKVYLTFKVFILSLGVLLSQAMCSYDNYPDFINYYVDSDIGNDENSGKSLLDPFRTISHAIEVITEENVISGKYKYFTLFLSSGTYEQSQSSVIPEIDDCRLTITGTNDIQCIIQNNSNISTLFVIKNSEICISNINLINKNGSCIDLNNSILSISGSSINDSEYGITILNSNANVEHCNITECSNFGIIANESSVLKLRNTDVFNNGIGIFIGNETLSDLGMSLSDSGNKVFGNNQCDCIVDSDIPGHAIGVTWDHAASYIPGNVCANGEDIVLYNDSLLVVDPILIKDESSPLFDNTKIISIYSPIPNNTIMTMKPEFLWKPSGQDIECCGVFLTPIIISENEIKNPEDIVWFWHSQQNNSIIGKVPFDFGFSNLKMNTPPKNLSPGSTYYWAVWAWDSAGRKITHSSSEIEFTVSKLPLAF